MTRLASIEFGTSLGLNVVENKLDWNVVLNRREDFVIMTHSIILISAWNLNCENWLISNIPV